MGNYLPEGADFDRSAPYNEQIHTISITVTREIVCPKDELDDMIEDFINELESLGDIDIQEVHAENR